MSEPPVDLDLDGDCYRRVILSRADSDSSVVTDLEDDFHHFRVRVRHDGRFVTDLSCESIRWPWSTCPDAAANLAGLIGAPLNPRFTHAAHLGDPRQNCTHQFDAAAHAIVHAHRGAPSRRYDIEVPVRDELGGTLTRLWTDGTPTLRWRFRWNVHVDPEPPFDNAPAGGFMAWADRALDPEAAEAAIALKRGATIGMGRGWPFDDFENAAQVEIGSSGVCYTMTTPRSVTATRVRGMIRDFSGRPAQMLDDTP